MSRISPGLATGPGTPTWWIKRDAAERSSSEAVHVCRERSGQGCPVAQYETGDGREPPEAPGIWSQQQEGIGHSRDRVHQRQRFSAPAIGEHAHSC